MLCLFSYYMLNGDALIFFMLFLNGFLHNFINVSMLSEIMCRNVYVQDYASTSYIHVISSEISKFCWKTYLASMNESHMVYFLLLQIKFNAKHKKMGMKFSSYLLVIV
ncbi:hypothetical protein KFK09_006860 [Dendrobium nobile]|uniref:Uncharacterized protein n=1 Tax=Dendrobium nobile TaxID=94219 RepID=A0A8T3BV75_DENNO|nr:hypothetical protein KFK09_006860 [Dendrobium nobile]